MWIRPDLRKAIIWSAQDKNIVHASNRNMGTTLFEKIWDRHVIKTIDGGPSVLYIDRHFIHEVTSPQAFQGLEQRGLKVFRPKQVIATADHNVPTLNQHLPIKEELSRIQVQTLRENCEKFGIELYGLGILTRASCMSSGPSWESPNRA